MLDIKSKNNESGKFKKIKNKWLFYLICLPMLAAIVYMVRYPQLKMTAEEQYENPMETEAFIWNFYMSNYVLYKDLYEKVNETQVSYRELYLDIIPQEGKTEDIKDYLENSDLTADMKGNPEDLYLSHVLNEDDSFAEMETDFFERLEEPFHNLSRIFDYSITDDKTGKTITNSGRNLSSPEEFYLYFRVTYDASGKVSSHCVRGENPDAFLKRASETGRNNPLAQLQESIDSRYYLQAGIKGPVSCTVAYGITLENWENIKDKMIVTSDGLEISSDFVYYTWNRTEDLFLYNSLAEYFVLLALAVAILALLLPFGEKTPWKFRIFKLPFEIVFIIFCFLPGFLDFLAGQSARVITGRQAKLISSQWRIPENGSWILAYVLNFAFCAFSFLAVMFLVYNVRQIRETGLKAYIRKYSYIYRFFPFVKSKLVSFYNYMSSFDVSTETNKVIIRLLVVNAVIVFFICSFWFFGFFGVLVYSVLLYFVLRKYFNDLKKKYDILLRATNRIAEGNLQVVIPEYLGIFEPFKPQIDKIQEGFRNAVEEEVKSQRMKTELITNVSHDLKTPLTAIITYVNLLKDENLTPEQRKEYVDTLERKSMRLKVLIEDLFEVSKATSKNITLNLMDVDVVNLIKQVQLELEEQLQAAGLSVRMHAPEGKVSVKLDSQKTYRIYENLIGNICKYALRDTRVYIDVTEEENSVSVVLKNISATELTVNPMELTERFVRGDSSRNTEGSGLGLAIAKSFTELQNGKMSLELDGDLFKVTTVWYK